MDEVRFVDFVDGLGLAAPDHAQALPRGGRLDEAEAGSGLGLPIAREIAEGVDGALRLGPTAPGAMTVALVLPASAPADGPLTPHGGAASAPMGQDRRPSED